MTDYPDVDAMWRAAMADAVAGRAVQSRYGDMHETIGWRGTLLNPRRNFLTNSARAACPTYASAELIWYLSRAARVDTLLPYAPSYKRFAEPDGTAHGAYGYRIATNAKKDQLDGAVRRLRIEPLTRQCVVSMWRPDDLFCEEKRDVPCTVVWQFLLRHSELHMVAYMRSNDLWLGFPYDVYTFTCIQQMIAASLGIGVGTYTHCVGSMHAYDKDLDAVREALAEWCDPVPEHDWAPCPIEKGQDAVKLETAWRQGWPKDAKQPITLRGCLADSVACIGRRWGVDTVVTSPSLRKGLENVDHRRARSRRKDDASKGASAVTQ